MKRLFHEGLMATVILKSADWGVSVLYHKFLSWMYRSSAFLVFDAMMEIYWVITVILLLLLETYTQAHKLNSSNTLVSFLLHDCHHRRRRCHCNNSALQSIIIIIIIFLHRLGRLTCSGIDALPLFPRASTVSSSSSRFVVEGVPSIFAFIVVFWTQQGCITLAVWYRSFTFKF